MIFSTKPVICNRKRICRQLFPVYVIIASLVIASCAQPAVEYLPRVFVKPVTIRIDNSVVYQDIEGFGATTRASVMYTGNGLKDLLEPSLRQQAIDAVYGQAGLTMGNLEFWMEPVNDDGNPFTYNWKGFMLSGPDTMYRLLVQPALEAGFDNYSLGLKIDMRRHLAWLKPLRNTDYRRYLDEISEFVTAGMIYWRDKSGFTPRYISLFNEPLSGNRELRGGDVNEVIDIIIHAGDRLRSEGFAEVLFIVPGEETVEKSLRTAEAILADDRARKYVGAISYHAYPYHSSYSSIRRILQKSGAGEPEPEEIRIRNELKQLGEKYNIPVWMTEISEGPGNAEYEFGADENLRARAIHIHDELVHANASAFFGMNNMWDRRIHEAHFKNRNVGFFTESSSIALIDQDASEVYISGMGYAIGHYARWIKRGAVRIDAMTDDSHIQVSAFRDDAAGRLVAVIINNNDDNREINVLLDNIRIGSPVTGEQSAEGLRWDRITGFAPGAPDRMRLNMLPLSVMTVSAPIQVNQRGYD